MLHCNLKEKMPKNQRLSRKRIIIIMIMTFINERTH